MAREVSASRTAATVLAGLPFLRTYAAEDAICIHV